MIDFSNQPSYDMTFEIYGDEIPTTVINDSTGTEFLPSGESIDLIYQRIINNSSFGDEAVYKLSEKIGYIEYGLLFPDIGTGFCDVDLVVNLRCKISGTDTIRLTDLDCFEPSIKSSAKDISLKAPMVFPNPTQGIINMKGPYSILGIQNVAGSIMKFTAHSNKIDISTFPNGIYFLKLKDDRTLQIYTQKIVKM